MSLSSRLIRRLSSVSRPSWTQRYSSSSSKPSPASNTHTTSASPSSSSATRCRSDVLPVPWSPTRVIKPLRDRIPCSNEATASRVLALSKQLSSCRSLPKGFEFISKILSSIPLVSLDWPMSGPNTHSCMSNGRATAWEGGDGEPEAGLSAVKTCYHGCFAGWWRAGGGLKSYRQRFNSSPCWTFMNSRELAAG